MSDIALNESLAHSYEQACERLRQALEDAERAPNAAALFAVHQNETGSDDSSGLAAWPA